MLFDALQSTLVPPRRAELDCESDMHSGSPHAKSAHLLESEAGILLVATTSSNSQPVHVARSPRHVEI